MRLISNVYSNEHLSLKIIYGKLELISIEMLALIFKLLYLLNLFKTVILKIGIHFYSNHVQYIIAYIYIIQDRRVAQYCTHSVPWRTRRITCNWGAICLQSLPGHSRCTPLHSARSLRGRHSPFGSAQKREGNTTESAGWRGFPSDMGRVLTSKYITCTTYHKIWTPPKTNWKQTIKDIGNQLTCALRHG